MNPARQRRIKGNLLRSRILAGVRQFFEQNGFLEVETPLRLTAPAPEPNLDAVGSGSHFLQASPELHMKRLLCAGFDKIFQICKCFRHSERGASPAGIYDARMVCVGADYHFLMNQVEKLVYFVKHKALGSTGGSLRQP
jgi:elongation factor P--(R)-beta-lysine ligase